MSDREQISTWDRAKEWIDIIPLLEHMVNEVKNFKDCKDFELRCLHDKINHLYQNAKKMKNGDYILTKIIK